MNASADKPPHIEITEFTGRRSELRFLFELAEDSAEELESYIDAGRVLVATDQAGVVGHLQLTPRHTTAEAEVKNMAVLPACQRHGIGRRLIASAIESARLGGATRLFVATAAADTDNLRFYQRCGFRLHSVERDVFTPDRGYPAGTLSNGIELRDRVWLECILEPRGTDD